MTDPAAWVYLLRCRDGSLYCGWTTDLPRRLDRHRAGTASRYTASRLPVELALALPMDDRSAARREEARIKQLSRAAKLRLLGDHAIEADEGQTDALSSFRVGRMTAADPALELRPLAAADVPELRRIRATREVYRWWGELEDDFPLGDDPESVRLTIVVDGAVAGLIQYGEELEPRYRSASVDIFLDPARRGRGLGTEALRRVVATLVGERGHHRITIDPAVDNAAAIRSYEKAGFRPVGVMRAYERDPDSDKWHDGLLMEFIAH